MTFIRIAAPDLAIDLGTTNTLVYRKNKGIIINEPSCVAMDINNGQIVAIGNTAEELIGKTPANIVIFRALDDGVISDYEITRTMVKYFLDKSLSGLSILAPRVVACVPTGITDVERRAVEDAVIQAGARDVLLIEESLASIAGLREDAFESKGNMVINIGGGITEIAVSSMGRIVTSKSIKVGGDYINKEIIEFIKEKNNVLIGEKTAEEIKINIGTLDTEKENQEYTVMGRDMTTGLPINVIVHSEDISVIIQKAILQVIDGLRYVLERTPPELVNDVIERGLLLTGGTSKIDNISEFIIDYVSVPIEIDSNPFTSTVIGAGSFITKFTEIKKTRIKKYS